MYDNDYFHINNFERIAASFWRIRAMLFLAGRCSIIKQGDELKKQLALNMAQWTLWHTDSNSLYRLVYTEERRMFTNRALVRVQWVLQTKKPYW